MNFEKKLYFVLSLCEFLHTRWVQLKSERDVNFNIAITVFQWKKLFLAYGHVIATLLTCQILLHILGSTPAFQYHEAHSVSILLCLGFSQMNYPLEIPCEWTDGSYEYKCILIRYVNNIINSYQILMSVSDMNLSFFQIPVHLDLTEFEYTNKIYP